MDTRQLKTFRTLAKNLSFSKTAEELNYAQSSISAQIRSLENELRLTLFDRLGKKVMLTDDGKNVLEYAKRFRAIEDEFIQNIKHQGKITGELSIYAPNSICVYLLPTILTKFRAEHPDVTFKLRAHLGTKQALNELRNGTIDLMCVMEETFTDPDFKISNLRAEEIIAVCHNDHPLAQVDDVSLRDLSTEDFILTEPSCGYRAIMTREMRALGYKLDPVMWFDNAEAIKQCIMANMGISFLPKMTVQDDLKNNLFSQIKLSQKFDSQIKLQMITHKQKWLSPAQQAFMTALEESVQ